MNTETISVVANFCSIVISAFISWFIAKSSAKKELDRLKLTWAREDVVSSDEEFAEMARLVSVFISCYSITSAREAMAEVAAIRTKESGDMGCLLDLLYDSIRKRDGETPCLLDRIIEEKRKAKRTESAQK